MKYKYLFFIVIVLLSLTACQSSAPEPESAVGEDEVVLVLVDGQPITLPMLEYTMEARGISEDDHDAMRSALDELIRLQAVANEARSSGLADQPRVKAHQRLRSLEALQISYFEQLAQEQPISDAEIETAYRAQIERAGQRQYQIETIVYTNQPAVLTALESIEEGSADFEALARQARANGLAVDEPLWVDLSQLPPDIGSLLQEAESGAVLSLPLQTQQGWRLVRLSDTRRLQPPALEQVRQGIVRTLARERVNARVDELYEASEITPMLPLEDEQPTSTP